MKTISKVVGIRFYEGEVSVNESVELRRENDPKFPKAIGVYNSQGIKVGNICNKIDDFDLINGIKTNLDLYDEIELFDWKVKRIARWYIAIEGFKKSVDVIQVEETIRNLEEAVAAHKKNLSLLVLEYEIAESNEDYVTSVHLRTHIEFLQRLHNDQSNELMGLKNSLILLRGDKEQEAIDCAK